MPVWLDHLKKDYLSPDGEKVPVIDIEDFRLSDGEQVALVGGSGTGKTTLLHLIAGILKPDSGRICFGQEGGQDGAGMIDIAALTEAHRDQFRGRHLGYIFQTHHLLGGFSALEN